MRRRLPPALVAIALAIALCAAGRGWVRDACAGALTRDRIEGCRCCPTRDEAPRHEAGIAARCCDVDEAPPLETAPAATTTAAPTLALAPRAAAIVTATTPPAPEARITAVTPRAIGPPRYLELCVLRL